MKKIFALTAAAILSIGSAQSGIIFQTQNYSNVNASTAGTALSLLWNKFDTGLGTLTAITMEISGNLTGSFTLVNNSEAAAEVSNSSAVFRMNFSSGTGVPSNITGSTVSPISTTPSTGATPSEVSALSTQVFDINGSVGLYNESFNYFSDAAYFSSVGPGTFNTLLFRNVSATVGGESFSLNTAASLMDGTINLTYEYTPAEVIPEPGTWAAAALLVGGAAFMRWRRRQTA
jgi:hypothetical protein